MRVKMQGFDNLFLQIPTNFTITFQNILDSVQIVTFLVLWATLLVFIKQTKNQKLELQTSNYLAIFQQLDFRDDRIADVVGDIRLLDNLLDERIQFAGFAHHLQFHRAVIEVFHPTTNVEAARQLLDGVAETHTLDTTFEYDLLGDHGRSGWFRVIG